MKKAKPDRYFVQGETVRPEPRVYFASRVGNHYASVVTRDRRQAARWVAELNAGTRLEPVRLPSVPASAVLRFHDVPEGVTYDEFNNPKRNRRRKANADEPLYSTLSKARREANARELAREQMAAHYAPAGLAHGGVVVGKKRMSRRVNIDMETFSPHGMRGGRGEPNPIERLLERSVFHSVRFRKNMYIVGALSGFTEFAKAGPTKRARDINAAFAAKQIKATKKRKAPR